ncbi:MAG: FAD-dependent oxidoreductase [Chloroflexaceae bacterium]|nr:FAD-dependent oxidoreductase [Chloroflexaceae bacterium]
MAWGEVMAVEYDLVVIGNTSEARWAAALAARFQARVALVQPTFEPASSAAIAGRAFQQALTWQQQWQGAAANGLYVSLERAYLSPTGVQAWAADLSPTIAAESPMLTALGVDVVVGAGEFVRLPQLAFVCGQRRLRSRAYLLAVGSVPGISEIPGLEAVGYLTPATLWSGDKLASLPQRLALIGNDPEAIALAQSLQRLGKTVTLIVESGQLLAEADWEASLLVQAQLEAEGVQIFLGESVLQVRALDGAKWLQVGDRALEVEEILIDAAVEPNLSGLNLEGLGISLAAGLPVNSKLQTSHPRIYACGGAGRDCETRARYEAEVAVKNALFGNFFRVNGRYLPRVLRCDPPLAWLGLTEGQASQRYQKNIYVLRQPFKSLAEAQFLSATTGFGKIIVQGNGKIVGAHLVGPQAGELIGAIALAAQENIKLQALGTVFPAGTLSEIIFEIGDRWRQERWQRRGWLRNLGETWLLWRRSWQ